MPLSLQTSHPFYETMHGVTICDPYRWLEDRSLPETENWIRGQQRRCDDYFRLCPGLAVLERRVKDYLDVEVIDQPTRIGEQYFYRKRERGQQQGCICMREGVNGGERILVDPSANGPYASVGIYRISCDGAYLACVQRRGGEDRNEIRIIDVNCGVVLPDRIACGYARGFAFTSDGYLYSHDLAGSNDDFTICHHRFDSHGTDAVIFRRPRVPGGRLILISDADRIGALWLRPDGGDVLTDLFIAQYSETQAWREVIREKRSPVSPILLRGRIFALVETESKRSKLIELSMTGQELHTVVPEQNSPIRGFAVSEDKIFVEYQENRTTSIEGWLLTGERTGPVSLPAGGTVQILPSFAHDTDSFFYSFESFTTPPAIYEYCSSAGRSSLWHQRGPLFACRQCQVEEIDVLSHDGTAIPLTLVRFESIGRTPAAPVIMTSYGGFGVAMTPRFSVLVSIMMELGATFALPHIRGGGEFGARWHDAGRAGKRQVAFDDFLATAQWLTDQGIVAQHQLGIFGGSNAGLLVAAAMTQRPDLFGAVLCMAPLLDMLRYEVFDQASKWRQEYGTVSDRDDFAALYAYSPYHHIAEGADYPATMFVSGDKDDRCNPAHVRKMAAQLQDRDSQRNPIIVDYSEQRGHWPALPLSTRIEALARRIAFLCKGLNIAVSIGG